MNWRCAAYCARSRSPSSGSAASFRSRPTPGRSSHRLRFCPRARNAAKLRMELLCRGGSLRTSSLRGQGSGSRFCFLGYYPLVKPNLDAISSKALRLFAKLGLCTVSMGVMYALIILSSSSPPSCRSFPRAQRGCCGRRRRWGFCSFCLRSAHRPAGGRLSPPPW